MDQVSRLVLCLQFLWNAFYYLHSADSKLKPKELLKVWEISEGRLKCGKKKRESISRYLFSLLQKGMPKKELRKAWSGEKIEPYFEQFLAELPELSETMREVEVSQILFVGFVTACMEQSDADFAERIAKRASDLAIKAGCTGEEISKVCTPIMQQIMQQNQPNPSSSLSKK